MNNQIENQVEVQLQNKKAGKGKIFAIIILVILLLGAVGYIAYDKFFTKEIKETEKAENNATKEKNETVNNNLGFNINNKSKLQHFNFWTGEGHDYHFYITKDGDVYLTAQYAQIDNTNPNIKAKESIENLQKQYKDNTISGYCNVDGDLAKEICPNGDNIKSIKLNVENVIAGYNVNDGQEVWSTKIVFLNTNGTISLLRANNLDDGNLEIENNINDLTNIVSIVQSGTTGVPHGTNQIMAIEKDGSEHILNID